VNRVYARPARPARPARDNVTSIIDDGVAIKSWKL